MMMASVRMMNNLVPSARSNVTRVLDFKVIRPPSNAEGILMARALLLGCSPMLKVGRVSKLWR